MGAGHTARAFGFGGLVPMSNNGDVLWYLDWDDPDTTVDTGLMFPTAEMLGIDLVLPDFSYLWRKLNGTQFDPGVLGDGGRMPEGGESSAPRSCA